MAITQLMSEIQVLTELLASRQGISLRRPLQQTATDSTEFTLTVADLGIKCGDLFTVSEPSQSTTKRSRWISRATTPASSTPSDNLPLHSLEEPHA
jgi:hypothetical protein